MIKYIVYGTFALVLIFIVWLAYGPRPGPDYSGRYVMYTGHDANGNPVCEMADGSGRPCP